MISKVTRQLVSNAKTISSTAKIITVVKMSSDHCIASTAFSFSWLDVLDHFK